MKLPRYPKYKDSGVKWLGAVPEHWRNGALTRVATRIVVGIAEAATYAYVDDGVPILRSTNIRAGRIIGEVLRVDAEYAAARGSKAIQSDDLITVRTGNAGVTALIPPELDGCQCFTMLITTLTKAALPKFYCYYLNCDIAQKYFSVEGWGTAQVNISVPILKALPISIPPTEEQAVIVAFLDKAVNHIDMLIEEQLRMLELLNEKVTSLVLSSISSTETKEVRLNSVARVVKRPVSQGEGESYTAIGLFNRGRGLFHKDSREADEMGDSDFFWIEEGDLILSGQFAWEGSVALAGSEDAGCVVSHRYPVLRGIPGTSITEYLLALFMTKHGDFLLNENSRGAAGRNRPLNINSLLKEKVPIPNMQTQEKIARAVHWRKALLCEMSRQVEFLNERRSALITAAVTGQIDVRNYRPQEDSTVCQ
jgi:type I restriction enzyme S subunit